MGKKINYTVDNGIQETAQVVIVNKDSERPKVTTATPRDISVTELQRNFALSSPRNLREVLQSVIQEMKEFPALAESFYYSIPYTDYSEEEPRKVYVEGLTIKAAMALLRYWKNCATMTTITDEDDRKIIVEGGIYDFETNTLIKRSYAVSKTRYNKRTKTIENVSPSKLVADIQAGMSKALRNTILSVIPDHIKIEAFSEAKKIASKSIGGGEVKNLNKRIEIMFKKFADIGIPKDRVIKHINKQEKDITEDDIGNMIAVYNGITQEGIPVEEYFPVEKPVHKTKVEAELKNLLTNK